MLVLRPADAMETNVAWKMAIENTKTPTALILSRQNIEDLPTKQNSTRYDDALLSKRGAYIVNELTDEPDVILVGNGSEVSTLIAGAKLLEKERHFKVQVVSAISEGLFRDQDIEYQLQVIPEHLPVFGLTAGLPVALESLVGAKGKVFGLDHFGYSAPAKVLDNEFGFTAENVFNKVLEYLETYTPANS